MAAPRLWAAHGQKIDSVLVDTPQIVRARFLSDLYHQLLKFEVPIDERLKTLLTLKNTAKVSCVLCVIIVAFLLLNLSFIVNDKEFDCNLSREIVNLIDREGDLMSRGRSHESLEGLRTRIANLFYQFLRVPEFNPEAAAFSKVRLISS
jgi:IQ and ubiquitin-like domain-containing protein